MRAHRHVRLLEAEPHAAAFRQRFGDRVEQILRGLTALERRVDLLGGLLDVAEVGDERAGLRPDERQPVGAAVPSQVPDVGQVGDEQHVDPGVGQQRDESVPARPHEGSSALISSSAVR